MIFEETEIYTRDGKKQELPGFQEKYVNYVDYILKITEEIWEERAIWVIHETYSKTIPLYTGARTITGIDSVINGTINTLHSFPDRKMGGEAVIWSKVGEKHFYSSHRIASTATNTGATEYGPATGKKVFFRTIADCLATENKIIEEWLVRDNLYLLEQLGFDPVEMAKKDQRYANIDIAIFNQEIQKGTSKNGMPYDLHKPADLILSLYNEVWADRQFNDLSRYYHPLANVHAICGKDLIGPRNIASYLSHLFDSFPEAHVQIERVSTNVIEEGFEVAARWRILGRHTGDGFFSPASGKPISMPGITHYLIKEGKIVEEWMVFDGFDTLCQIYKEEGKSLAPTNGIGHQESTTVHLKNKKKVLSFMKALDETINSTTNTKQVLKEHLSPKVVLNITKPFEENLKGIRSYANDFWLPLVQSFPDLETQPYILIGGEYEGRNYVSSTGNFIGTFKRDWLGIPATQQATWLRFAAHFMIENDKIVKAWFFFDVLDVMRQAGYHLFPNRGIDWVPPAPMTGDGIVTYPTNKKEGQKTLDLTNAMLDALGEYDGKTLSSMGQERFWDVQNMMWYGPSGIGTTRGLKGFQDYHQLPFLEAFPDRGITPKKGKEYFAQIGDGNYSCDFGFPAMYGSHKGDGWLGVSATGKKITLRVVDYWRREGNRLKENWVFIDMVDVLEQLGVDVFELLKEEVARKKEQVVSSLT